MDITSEVIFILIFYEIYQRQVNIMRIIQNKLFILLLILASVVIMPERQVFSLGTSVLSSTSNPNVLIFLDTSGSMMWNKEVYYNGTTQGYDAPESWAGSGSSYVWAPGSDSMYSKIYNAKLAISDMVTDPSFSNLNFAFATFYQNMGSTNTCVYSNDESFQNAANLNYFPYAGTTATGTPDESGAYGNYGNYPFFNGTCNSNSNLTISWDESNTTYYFISYDYPSYSNNGPWLLYVPNTVNGTLSKQTSTTVGSNSNNSTDPYFDPASIAGNAIEYVLWSAEDYGSNAVNPAGAPITGIEAGGDTPTYGAVGKMITYFSNSLQADSAGACRRNFSILITDGEANDNNASATPYELYELYKSDASYPIQTFMVGFGYAGTTGGNSYIQQMANAGAGISTTSSGANSPLQFSSTPGSSSTILSVPVSALTSTYSTSTSTNVILPGDTVSDNGWQSSDCESNNNNNGTYSNGFDCAVVTAVYPNSDEIELSNSLKTGGTIYVSGTVYLTYEYSQLVASLTTIFNQIEATVSSYTSPVIHQVYNTNGSGYEDVYYSDFKSLDQPLWGEGNIYLFSLNAQGQLAGPYGLATNSSGQIQTGDSYWDNGSGAGGLLQSQSASSRNIITSEINTSSGLITTININPSSSSFSITAAEGFLGITSSNYSKVCPSAVSESACVTDILDFVLNPDSATDDWKLGAIFNAQPVLVTSPAYAYSSNSYQSFKSQYSTRQQVLVAGANDGMLHGFASWAYNNSASSYYSYSNISQAGACGTGQCGGEMFGYIPPNFFDLEVTADTSAGSGNTAAPQSTACVSSDTAEKFPPITCWYESSLASPSIFQFVDSTPYLGDVFFGNIFNGTQNSADNSTNFPVSAASPQNSWHTVLIGGEGSGGNFYYSIDLTDPTKLGSVYPAPVYPAPLWTYTDSLMGSTMSEPVITYVCLSNPFYSNSNGVLNECSNNPGPSSPLLPPQYVKTWIALAGGGYSSNNSLGNALYALYAEPNPVNVGTSASPDYINEQQLWKFDASNDSNMSYSIPSAVAPVLAPDFELEAFYVGDLGGQMWAFDIPNGLSPNSGGSSSNNWPGCRLFASDASTSNPLNIFSPPSLSYDNSGNLWVYFGTGNVQNLSEIITSRDNEFIAINTGGTAGLGMCAIISSKSKSKSSPYNETNLTNITGTTAAGTQSVTSAGWYLQLGQGEKVIGSPVVYDNIVYFTTYTPSSAVSACGYGISRLYAVYYTNGGGTITGTSTGFTVNATPPGGTASQYMTISGGGVPSSPVITGGTLVVTTSAGTILQQTVPSMGSMLKPTSWYLMPYNYK